ncbi:MAG TPA: radical SAM family heme chaperone HemW [Phycisphaerales bacterium]|nr:radical SAM family heme chaperone HemW [Phycisphaerales bacterium]
MTALADHTPLEQFRQYPRHPHQSARLPLAESIASAGLRAAARSLYIHIPFCAHKCHYCDFYSFVDSRDRQPIFAKRLAHELRAIAPAAAGFPLSTIFIGGGTPSLLSLAAWKTILDALELAFDLSAIRNGQGEFTVECNPESVSPELMDLLRSAGVDRVSMGAQSFKPAHLQTLERLHTPDRVAEALDIAADAGIQRRSIDLIYAIPGQTLTDLERDLDAALALPVEHLSCYNLTYEPNTAMTHRLNLGQFSPCPEDLEIDMFNLIADRLTRAGFGRYEISNYALPGAECRHNMVYWRQGSWLAAGPSASAHVGGHRYKNIPRLETYLETSDTGFASIIDHEPPDPRRLIREKIMTGLRLSEGIDAGDLLAQLATLDPEAADSLESEAITVENSGLLSRSGGRWRLTDAGIIFADGIAADLMAAVG